MSAPAAAPGDAPPAAARGGWVELAAAALLSIAAASSSWCGYQGTHWSGVQMKSFGRASSLHVDAAREATRQQVMAAIDVSAFVSWLEARMRGEAETAAFLQHRFRPAFAPAFTAWLAESPFENAGATPTPFARPEYHLESPEAERLEAESRRHAELSITANGHVEAYVRNTVLFAVAMVFGGLGPRFRAPWVRVGFIVIGAGTLVFALWNLANII